MLDNLTRKSNVFSTLKGVFAKNEGGYKLEAKNKSLNDLFEIKLIFLRSELYVATF